MDPAEVQDFIEEENEANDPGTPEQSGTSEDLHMEKRATASPVNPADQSMLSDFAFKGNLNVTRSTMELLISKIGGRFRRPSSCIKLSGLNKLINLDYSQRYISIDTQCLLFIWYLTHEETYQMLAYRFAVPFPEVIVIIRYFIELMTESQLFPQGNFGLKELNSGFECMRPNAFPGVIGAIGTKYLTVRIPLSGMSMGVTLNELIAVQAIANSNLMFTDVYTAWIKRSYLKLWNTEETKAMTPLEKEHLFKNSRFYQKYCRGPKVKEAVRSTNLLKPDTHLVADESFQLMESVMVPYGKTKETTPSKILFDQQLEQTRSVIEVAFGMLLARFIRLRCLDYKLLRTEKLVKACVGLHNIAVENEDQFIAYEIKLPEIQIAHDEIEDGTAIAKRDRLCDEISSGKISYVHRGDQLITSVSF